MCGQPPSPRYVARVDPLRELCGFSAALERLLAAPDEPAFEAAWEAVDLQQLGWKALAHARRANTEALEPALAEVDRRLLAVLERARAFLDPHVVTFRVAELERWQHAAAAALVGARWGVAGLRTVIGDTRAPLPRRYFAFLALAERRPSDAWPLFRTYLRTPAAHHAFVAAAVEAARHYPELLVAGHTDPDPDRCEVTRALVAVRKLTGRVAPSAKFPDPADSAVARSLDEAERRFEAERDQLLPVTVI